LKKPSLKHQGNSSSNLSSNASTNSIDTTRRKTKFTRKNIKQSKEVQIYESLLIQLQGKNIEDLWSNPEPSKKHTKSEKTIAVVFKEEHIYIKFIHNEDELIIGVYVNELCNEECVNLSYSIDEKLFSINSILYENKKDSKCRGTPEHILSGTFYIEFIMSLIYSLNKMGLDIDVCQLEDSASVPHLLVKQNISLSILKLFDDCRTFYEGYGFLPSLGYVSNDLEEQTDYDFMSDEYISALRVLVSDRIIFFAKPIHRVLKLLKHKKLFRIDDKKLLDINLYKSQDDYELIIQELEILLKNINNIHKIDSINLSLNDIYEIAVKNQNKSLFSLLIGFMSFPLENITGDSPYYFPISSKITREGIDSIIRIYTKKHIHIYERMMRTLHNSVAN